MEERKKDEKTEEPEDLRKKCDEYLNGWKRAQADFINYKKDEFQRNTELIRFAKEDFLETILPIVDNLELSVKNLPQDLLENANVKGLLAVKTQLEDFLKSNGVEAIESISKKFDPSLHEVIQVVDAEGKESGTIIEEVQKGYMIQNRLLRPVKVKVVK